MTKIKMPLQLISKEWMEYIHIFADSNPEMTKWTFKFIPEELKPNNKDYLKQFCLAITYQALSSKVCDGMWKRFKDLMKNLGHTKIWPPEIVASLTDEQLIQEIKLSKRKAEAVRSIACYLSENVIDPFKTSETIIEEVSSKVKGVDPFTIKYFLLVCIGRLDISIYEDIIVRKGLKTIHGLNKVPTIPECKKLTSEWGTLASVGSLVCYNVYHYNK